MKVVKTVEIVRTIKVNRKTGSIERGCVSFWLAGEK